MMASRTGLVMAPVDPGDAHHAVDSHRAAQEPAITTNSSSRTITDCDKAPDTANAPQHLEDDELTITDVPQVQDLQEEEGQAYNVESIAGHWPRKATSHEQVLRYEVRWEGYEELSWVAKGDFLIADEDSDEELPDMILDYWKQRQKAKVNQAKQVKQQAPRTQRAGLRSAQQQHARLRSAKPQQQAGLKSAKQQQQQQAGLKSAKQQQQPRRRSAGIHDDVPTAGKKRKPATKQAAPNGRPAIKRRRGTAGRDVALPVGKDVSLSAQGPVGGSILSIQGHLPLNATHPSEVSAYTVMLPDDQLEVWDSSKFAGMTPLVEGGHSGAAASGVDLELYRVFVEYWSGYTQSDEGEEQPFAKRRRRKDQQQRQIIHKRLAADEESEEEYVVMTIKEIVGHFPETACKHEDVWLYKIEWEEAPGASWEYVWRLEEDLDASLAAARVEADAAKAIARVEADIIKATAGWQQPDELMGMQGSGHVAAEQQQQGCGGGATEEQQQQQGCGGGATEQQQQQQQPDESCDPYILIRDYWEGVYARHHVQQPDVLSSPVPSTASASTPEPASDCMILTTGWFVQQPSFRVLQPHDPADRCAVQLLAANLRWPLYSCSGKYRNNKQPWAGGKHSVRKEVEQAVRKAIQGQPAIDPAFLEIADVVLCTGHARPQDIAESVRMHPWKRWRGKHLVSHWGFKRLDRSCVVVDQSTSMVLMVVCLGRDYARLWGRRLQQVAGNHLNFERSMAAVHSHPVTARRAKDNQQLHMTGLRYCHLNARHSQEQSRVDMYAAKPNVTKAQLEQLKQCVEVAADGIYEAETQIAPQMGAARMAVGTAVAPDTTVVSKGCPVFSIGVSRGYMSLPHTDDSACNICETILFNSSQVPPGAGYTFASITAQVVVDLQADEHVLVMLPGGCQHGTPYLDNPELAEQGHQGIGVVIVNKSNLCLQDAYADLQRPDVQQRISSFYTQPRSKPKPPAPPALRGVQK